MEFNATFIVSTISFLIFVMLMNWIFYKPLEKIVGERKNFIDQNYDEANQATDKSKSILKDKDDKLDKTRLSAKKLISEKTEDATQTKETRTSDAKTRNADVIKSAKIELQKSGKDAQAVLDRDVVELAQMISDKVLGEHIPLETRSEAKHG